MKTKERLYSVRIRTKNFSAKPLRQEIFTPVRAIFRLGSTTMTEQVFPKSFKTRKIVEINTVEAVKNSSSKFKMKACFNEYDIQQADAYTYIEQTKKFKKMFTEGKDEILLLLKDLPYPMVAKKVYGFKAKGMLLIKTSKEMEVILKETKLNGYFFEKFYNYAREYRLHVTKDGYFLAWRKLRKTDSTERWFFNDSNCNWVSEEHQLFNRPKIWDKIVTDSVKALKAVGLDIGAVDVRVNTSVKTDQQYIICEINSAPALGDVGLEHYRKTIKHLITEKI